MLEKRSTLFILYFYSFNSDAFGAQKNLKISGICTKSVKSLKGLVEKWKFVQKVEFRRHVLHFPLEIVTKNVRNVKFLGNFRIFQYYANQYVSYVNKKIKQDIRGNVEYWYYSGN